MTKGLEVFEQPAFAEPTFNGVNIDRLGACLAIAAATGTSKDTIYDRFNQIMGNKGSLKSLPSDVCRFVYDCFAQRKGIGLFDWDKITLGQTVLFQGILDLVNGRDTDRSGREREIIERIITDFPSLENKVRPSTEVPSRYFLSVFDNLYSEQEKKRAADFIKANHLTPTKLAALLFSAFGFDERKSAELLSISIHTLKNQRTSIFAEDNLNVYDNTGAVIKAFQIGLLPEKLLQAIPAVKEGISKMKLLSEEEREVLRLLSEGKSNKEIAANRHKAVRTVRNKLTSIYRILGCRRTTAALIFLLAEHISEVETNSVVVYAREKERRENQYKKTLDRLRKIFVEIYRISDKSFNPKYNKDLDRRFKSTCGRIMAVLSIEKELGNTKTPKFGELQALWEVARIQVEDKGYKISTFKQYSDAILFPIEKKKRSKK